MRYLCIHGHFYQPPRENPWLEAIELQDSAYPYHDWNERINAESYAPNGATRILDGDGRIVRIVNNYSRISFNFGPTVLSWAEQNAPGLQQMVVDADRQSRESFSGHGSALAQVYNHMIMPLANTRDKRTQARWGIADFRHRFGREPEGMWLPETAVDLETLDVLAEEGIRFTILSPYQAHLVRALSSADEWVDVSGGRIDPTRPYRVRLPSGRAITVFFYDGPVARAVAFEGLLNNGEFFAQRLLGIFNDGRKWEQLAHIATDGESYGHHHRHGEMALAYALHHIATNGLAKITNYGEYLEQFPPAHEVEIIENSAWSCPHALGRWTLDCGCNSGGHPGWNQKWRAPLRRALDFLRDQVAPEYEAALGQFLRDPWAARDDYIHVMLDRSPENRAAFLARHAGREPAPEDAVRIWKLLELQRYAMLMYTSCGWFFDELSGIETVQVIQYAGRVVQLAGELFAKPIEEPFLEFLAHASSNLREHGDGAEIYRKFVKPTIVDLHKVGAHYAISSLFENYPDEAHVYCYKVERVDYRLSETGRLRMALGRALFTSEITQESDLLSFAVIHFGDHNLNAGVRSFQGQEDYEDLVREALGAFSRADVAEVIRVLDRGFGMNTYSLKSLFRDEQRKILGQLLNSTLEEAETAYRQLYEHQAPLMRFLGDLGTPLPKAFRTTAEYALNSHLKRELASDALDLARIHFLLQEAQTSNVDLDRTTLEFTFRKRLEALAHRFHEDPTDPQRLAPLAQAISLLPALRVNGSVWTVQNICYEILHSAYPEQRKKAAEGDREAADWVEQFEKIVESLSLKVP
ncbi:MAG: DUF3536 domain-containing protein [Acidobacteria bacterium]|nr:DUF3536 domain-containing protein [Acidobacteriota bacterium]